MNAFLKSGFFFFALISSPLEASGGYCQLFHGETISLGTIAPPAFPYLCVDGKEMSNGDRERESNIQSNGFKINHLESATARISNLFSIIYYIVP